MSKKNKPNQDLHSELKETSNIGDSPINDISETNTVSLNINKSLEKSEMLEMSKIQGTSAPLKTEGVAIDKIESNIDPDTSRPLKIKK